MRQLILATLIFSFAFANKCYSQIENSKYFMLSIFKAVDALEGNTDLYLNDGTYYNKMNEENVFIDIDPGTIVYSKYKYENGGLTYLKLVFSLPVTFRNNTCEGIRVDSITFANGRLEIAHVFKDKKQNCIKESKKTYGALIQNLLISKRPEDFFTGNLFDEENINTWYLCSDDKACPTKAKLINRIVFQHQPNDSALLIILKENKLITFNSTDSIYHSYLTIGKNSKLNLEYFDYNLTSGWFKGTINNFQISTNDGTFESANCRLKITDVTSVLFSNVEFKKDNASTIRFYDGNFLCKVGTGTKIKISNISSNGEIIIDEHSSIDFKSFEMEFNNNYSRIQFNHSKATLNITTGEFNFNPQTNLKIAKSHFDNAEISGDFTSRKEPQFQATIYNFTMQVVGGKFAINNESILELDSGIAQANSLNINSADKEVSITGIIDNFKVYVSNNSTFKIPNNGFEMQIKNGGIVSGGDANYPIKFNENSFFPTGEISYELPFLNFYNSSAKTFNLTNGVFTGKINNIGNEVYKGRDVGIIGDFPIKYSYMNTEFPLNIPLNIHNGKLEFSSVSGAEFKGLLDFGVQVLSNSISFKTPCMNDDQIDVPHLSDEHLYPITLNIKSSKKTQTTNQPISFLNGIVTDFSYTIPVYLDITIPEGCGEYDAGKDNDCNNLVGACQDDGGGHFPKEQELCRADVPDNCSIHFFVKPSTYNVNINFKVEYKNSKFKSKKPTLTISPSIFSEPLNILIDRDGCEKEENIISWVLRIFGKDALSINKSASDKINTTVNEQLQKLSQPIKLDLPFK